MLYCVFQVSTEDCCLSSVFVDVTSISSIISAQSTICLCKKALQKHTIYIGDMERVVLLLPQAGFYFRPTWFCFQCWNKTPSERPSFAAIREFLRRDPPPVMKALQRLSEPERLAVDAGDQIAIIDGHPELYWWLGQNLRTFQVGRFPRLVKTNCHRSF